MRNYFQRQRGNAGLTLGFLGLLLGIAFFLVDNGFFGEFEVPYPVAALAFATITILLSLILIFNRMKPSQTF